MIRFDFFAEGVQKGTSMQKSGLCAKKFSRTRTKVPSARRRKFRMIRFDFLQKAYEGTSMQKSGLCAEIFQPH